MQTTEPEMMSEHSAGARALIFRAARALAENGGLESLTLGKVATEAQLPRPVVYGQFVRKEDLLLCIAADSVAILARKIGGIECVHDPLKIEDNREGAVILTLPRPEPALEAPEEMVGLAREVSVALGKSANGGGAFASPNSERPAARRAEFTQLLEASTRSVRTGEVAVAGEASDGAATSPSNEPAVDQTIRSLVTSLEVGRREIERAVASMEARQEQVEQNSRASVAAAETSINEVLKKLVELVARVDGAETRQKSIANDVRTALNEASLRIQTVEGVARAALIENVPTQAVELPPMAGEPVSQAATETREAATGSQPAFSAAARASANAAGSANVEMGLPKWKLKLQSETRYVAAGLVVLAVFVTAASVAFSQGERDGRNEASRNLTVVAQSRAAASVAGRTRLDQLAERAEAGNADAELAVASKYLNDTGAARDPAAGFRWMTRSAVHGNPVAQYLLGTLYQQGVGTIANAVQSMHWYEAAALQGNRKAMHNLAIAYAEGLGGMKSPSEAVRWLSRAANLGYVDSQFDLAVLYERGEGVTQSLLDAYKWYAIAGAQGDVESKSRIDALRTQLSADDLAAAQHAADAFRALPFSIAANLPPKG